MPIISPPRFFAKYSDRTKIVFLCFVCFDVWLFRLKRDDVDNRALQGK